ncbi:MAG: BBE domain-containing protein [Betaproteobacteria bacterium]
MNASRDQAVRGQFLTRWNQMVEAYWNGEVYQNYPSVSDPNYALEYWGGAYPTLQLVKAKYDPGTFFVFAQGVVGDPGAQLPGNTPPAVVAALKVAPAHAGGLARQDKTSLHPYARG